MEKQFYGFNSTKLRELIQFINSEHFTKEDIVTIFFGSDTYNLIYYK